MSKYIRDNSPADNGPDALWILGMMEISLYIAASFPGTNLFGSIPIQKLSLFLLLGQGIIAIIYYMKDGIQLPIYMVWYGIFALLSFLTLVLLCNKTTNDEFRSILICLAITTVFSLYIDSEKAFRVICWSYIMVCLINTIALVATDALNLEAGDRLGTEMEINPNEIANFLMYGVVYAVWLIIFEKNNAKRLILLCITLIIAYPLVLTGGRKFFLAPLFFMGMILVMKGDPNKGSSRVKYLFMIFCILTIIWYVIMTIPALYNSLGYRLEGLLNSVTGQGEADMSSQERKQLRQLAINGWLSSPLWGKGLDMFKYFSRANGLPFFYSHSNITELLYSGGVILFLSYYWFFGYIFWKCRTDKSIQYDLKLFCIPGILTQTIFDYGGVSYNVFHTQLFILLIFCAMEGYKNCSLRFTYTPLTYIPGGQKRQDKKGNKG